MTTENQIKKKKMKEDSLLYKVWFWMYNGPLEETSIAVSACIGALVAILTGMVLTKLFNFIQPQALIGFLYVLGSLVVCIMEIVIVVGTAVWMCNTDPRRYLEKSKC